MSNRTLKSIRRDILNSWPAILRAARTLPVTPPASPTLLGTSTKVEKGDKRYETRVIYMAPDREAFAEGDTRTLCPSATPRCSATCLGHSTGRLIMTPNKRARLWKAALYLGARKLWRELLSAEIDAHARSCHKRGTAPVIRIDGSTDTGEGKLFAEMFPEVQFYDYTKVRARVLNGDGAARKLAPNYSLTLSRSGENDSDIRDAIDARVNVAVVFSSAPGEPMPKSFQGAPVINGDETDLRFTDARGVVVGLSFKAARNRLGALKRAGNFVVEVA